MLLTSSLVKAGNPDTLLLDQVEVYADRNTGLNTNAYYHVDSLILNASTNQNLGQLLMRHSSLFIKDYGPGGLATASFRGTAANHTLVLWNDIPLNAPNLGQVDFSTIPVFLVEEIGMLWGSKAARTRAGGIGGVVTIDNKPDFNRGLRGNIMQTVGSFNTINTYATLGFSNQRLYAKTRIFRRTSENNFQYLNNGIIPKKRTIQKDAGYKDYGLLQEFGYAGKRSMIEFISWNQWNSRNLPPIMTNLERGGNPKEKREDRFSRNILSYKYYFGKNGKLEVKTAILSDYQHYFLQTTTSNGNHIVSLIDSRNQSHSWMNSVGIEQSVSNGIDFFAKLLYDSEKVNSDNYVETHKRTRIAAISGLHLVILDRFNSTFSLKYDVADDKPIGFSPALELNFLISPKNKFFIGTGLSNNFRYPNLNDLYWFPGGNPKLLPEKSRTIDFYLSYTLSNSYLNWTNKASLYMSEIDNWIQWRPTSYRFWIPANIALVFARGIEWHSSLNGVHRDLSWQVFFNYAYTLTTDESPIARIENSSGKQLIYIPKHHGNAYLDITYQDLKFCWNYNYTGERTTTIGSSSPFFGKLPPYTLNSFSIGRLLDTSYGSFEFEFRVNNVFNVDYQAILWRPMPGRSFEGIVKFAF